MKHLKNNTERVTNNESKTSETITLIGKYGSKIIISAEAASKANLELLNKLAERQNEENIAEHTIRNTK